MANLLTGYQEDIRVIKEQTGRMEMVSDHMEIMKAMINVLFRTLQC